MDSAFGSRDVTPIPRTFSLTNQTLGMTLVGVTQLVGALSCAPKGGGFDPWSGHVREETD